MVSTIITILLVLVTAIGILLVAIAGDFEARLETIATWFSVAISSAILLLIIPIRSESEYVKPTYIDKDSTRVFVLLPGDHTFSSSDYSSVTNIDTSTVFKITHDYNYYGFESNTTVSN